MNQLERCRIEVLSEHTGVEVTGLDLREPVPGNVQEMLNRQFVERSVLVIRDQSLAPAQMVEAVELLGDIFIQHNSKFALPECPQIHYISNRDHYPDGTRYIPGSGYHTDHSNDVMPPKATVLHAVELPDSGGDTQFVNMHRAYEALDSGLKAKVQGRRAGHVYQSRFSARKLMGLPPEREAQLAKETWHPIVRTHPDSGRKALYINPIRIERIEGLEEADGLALLDELMAHVSQPCFEYRHRWRRGDLVFWDNRCLLHKANPDYDMDQLRYLYRVMLQGDTPR